MTQKEDKIKLIIQSLEKIYELSKEDEVDMYKKLTLKDEQYCDNLIKKISKYIDNQRKLDKELIDGIKKKKNTFQEKVEQMIEESEIEKLI